METDLRIVIKNADLASIVTDYLQEKGVAEADVLSYCECIDIDHGDGSEVKFFFSRKVEIV